jgi:quinol-cytochrome oxidoreductase complex cytochrome b subunit
VVDILTFGVGGLLLLVFPFLDRRAARGQAGHLSTGIGPLLILYMLVLTYLGDTVSPTK